MEVLDHGIQVEALEFLGIIERLVHRIGQRGVLVQDVEAQLIGPPFRIVRGPSRRVSASAARYRALGFACNLLFLFSGNRRRSYRGGCLIHWFTFLRISQETNWLKKL